ncbi:MAG: hypothetical protein APR62_12570 [Smithella sp. SDB]|nr:MAG: hypothetical protein APR62_12570 [Smithella sp. SDB]
MSTDTGNLSTGSVTTGDEGTATLTFSSGSNPINRTATITATSGSISSLVQVEVVDSTVTLSADGSSLTTAGTDSITLTITAKNAGGYGVNGASVILTQSSTDGGSVTFAASTGTTSTVNSTAGVFKTTVTGATAGTVTIISRALGTSASTNVTVATAAETFAVDKQWLDTVDIGNPNPSAMEVGQDLEIQVNVPTSVSNVTFSTTYGSWAGGSGTWIQVPAAGVSPNRKASAILNTDAATTANVMVYDTANTSTNDTLQVYMTSDASPNSIILQASPTVVSINTGTSTITATVRDSGGFVVANQPISFSIVNPTGGGETISPAVVQTAANGQASTTFTAGSLTSYDAGGVKIHAEVIGTASPMVGTGVSPSGNDAAVVIGGQPGSIAFGQATVLSTDDSLSQYIQAMSVLVTDINGNPVSGATVSLSAWPIAWSTGVLAACAYDPDNGTDQGTFLNEDVNENLILDNYGNPYLSGDPPPFDEDGLRLYYDGGTPATTAGNPDTYITPTNSAGGSVPATVTTGSNGVASFNLTYPKQSAIWTVTRIRASTIVQGSETVGQTIFRLPCTDNDCGSTCRLGYSPYTF